MKGIRLPYGSFAGAIIAMMLMSFFTDACTAQDYLDEYKRGLSEEKARLEADRAAVAEQEARAKRGRIVPQPAAPGSMVALVKIEGNQVVPDDQVLARLRTRANRRFDPDMVQADTREIMRMRFFRSVKTFTESDLEGRAIITFKVIERPFIDNVKIIGNRQLTDRALRKHIDLEKGMPLDIYAVKMAKQRIESFYEQKGFEHTEVQILEGDKIEDQQVVFLVNEDEPRRIASVQVQGNTVVSAGRLRSFIKSKKSILRTFGGKFSKTQLEADKQTLTAYYRSLGFFNARVGADASTNANGKLVNILFVIDEGPRFKVRHVRFVGQEKYSEEELLTLLELQPGELYNAAHRQRDITTITDLYGSQGHISVEVLPENLFFEEPGHLDLIYKISEGPQFRVGKVDVAIDGDHGITKKQVVLNRLGLKPGDVIDMRKVRAAERRLASSQLFTSPQGGAVKLQIKPREPGRLAMNDQVRYQSVDGKGPRVVLLDFSVR